MPPLRPPFIPVEVGTRDLVIQTAQRLEDVDQRLREFQVESRQNAKDAMEHFAKYDDIISRMSGVWWVVGVIGGLAGLFGAVVYRWFMGGGK